MKALLASIAITLLAAPAFAVLGLPYADDATTRQGEIGVTGSATFESDVNLYGVRGSYGIIDGLSIFLGGGLVDPDEGSVDSEPFVQVGGTFTLPLELPVDLALRGSFGMASFEAKESASGPGWSVSAKGDLDIWTLNAGVLASMAVDPMITVYGFGGISYQNTKMKIRYTETFLGISDSGSMSESDTDTELAIAGGGMFHLNENITLGAEISHIDDTFISVYGRFTL
jgi:opacity protein-like surface antigen